MLPACAHGLMWGLQGHFQLRAGNCALWDYQRCVVFFCINTNAVRGVNQAQMCVIHSILVNLIVSWSLCRPMLENKSNFVTGRSGHAKATDGSQLILVKSAFSSSFPDFLWSSPRQEKGVMPLA